MPACGPYRETNLPQSEPRRWRYRDYQSLQVNALDSSLKSCFCRADRNLHPRHGLTAIELMDAIEARFRLKVAVERAVAEFAWESDNSFDNSGITPHNSGITVANRDNNKFHLSARYKHLRNGFLVVRHAGGGLATAIHFNIVGQVVDCIFMYPRKTGV